jgi:sulfite exporter TauE/SafE
MNVELEILLATAVSIGFVHTVLGPDHYIPFIMLAKASKWSKSKTIFITLLSGVAHVLSSVVVGLIGVALGIAVHKLSFFESVRGNIAGYLLIAFGLAYTIYGIRKSHKAKIHSHSHFHSDGQTHLHEHNHSKSDHLHLHNDAKADKIKFWAVFAVFIFGPCEPLIPILMYPAAKSSIAWTILVVIVFGVITISTMLAIVMLSLKGIDLLPISKLEKHIDVIAGVIILLSGLMMQFFGM